VEARGRRVTTVESVDQADAAIHTASPDLVVLDLMLPAEDVRDLLARIRATPAATSIPVVVISPLVEPNIKRDCMALGADHFLEKPCDLELLAAMVTSAVGRRRILSETHTADALTGLINRAAFEEVFKSMHAVMARVGSPLSLALLDLDRFKSVNDVYGHAAGDEVLRRWSAILSSTLRAADTIARWGGEEFVVLFVDTDTAGAHTALAKAQDALRDEVFTTKIGDLSGVTFSAGLVPVLRDSGLDATMPRADRLLYVAKRSGRDMVATESSDLEARRLDVLLVEDDQDMARHVSALLEAHGYAVEHHGTGESALSISGDRRVSLVVLDALLPGIDGPDVLRSIRRQARNRTTPVMMLTAVEAEEAIEAAFDLGIDDYVTKPFKEREFLARVRRLVGR